MEEKTCKQMEQKSNVIVCDAGTQGYGSGLVGPYAQPGRKSRGWPDRGEVGVGGEGEASFAASTRILSYLSTGLTGKV